MYNFKTHFFFLIIKISKNRSYFEKLKEKKNLNTITHFFQNFIPEYRKKVKDIVVLPCKEITCTLLECSTISDSVIYI